MSEMQQMKFRISNPDQFDDLVDALVGFGWGFRKPEQDATTWKISRRYSADFIYTCVLDNPTRYVVDYGVTESFFVECADEYREMDTDEFIRSFVQEKIADAIDEVAAGEAEYFAAIAAYAQSHYHPHRDIMIALANDTRTIVEVLRKDGQWAVTDNPVFNPHQQFRIGKSNLEKLIAALIVEIDGDSDKLKQVHTALSAH